MTDRERLHDFAYHYPPYDKIKDLSDEEKYKIIDDILALSLKMIWSTFPGLDLWHTGSVKYNTWQLGRSTEMDKVITCDSKEQGLRLLEIMFRNKKK